MEIPQRLLSTDQGFKIINMNIHNILETERTKHNSRA
jgi:hypothetical protein